MEVEIEKEKWKEEVMINELKYEEKGLKVGGDEGRKDRIKKWADLNFWLIKRRRGRESEYRKDQQAVVHWYLNLVTAFISSMSSIQQ